MGSRRRRVAIAVGASLGVHALVAVFAAFSAINVSWRMPHSTAIMTIDVIGVAPDSAQPATPDAPADKPDKPDPADEHDAKQAEPAADKPAEPKAHQPRPAVAQAPKPLRVPPRAPVTAPSGPDASVPRSTPTPPAPPTPIDPPQAATDPPDVPWPLDEPARKAATHAELVSASPGTAALYLAVRLDRLAGTAWYDGFDRILAPMPDYRSIMGPLNTAGAHEHVGDLFDLLFIATPDPRDVSATFLAAHHGRTNDALEQKLGAGVAWSAGVGGAVGNRKIDRDSRLFLLPAPHWVVLARPELLGALATPAPAPVAATTGVDAGPLGADAGPQVATAAPPSAAAPTPAWLARLEALRGGTAQGPLAWLALGDLGGELKLPGAPALPAPMRTLVAVMAAPDGGLDLVAQLTFSTPARALAFAEGARALKAQVEGSMTERFILDHVHAKGLVLGMEFVVRGNEVALTTHAPSDDCAGMLEAAATWSAGYFASRRQ